MENTLKSFKFSLNVEDETSTFDFTKQSWRDDVTFLVEDKRLYASKSVLAIISPVFESMFGAGFKERTENQVSMPGKKAADFLEFLHCVYPTSNRTVTKDNVFQVLPLAHEYQVEQLVEKCRNVLEKCVSDGEDFEIKDLLKCYAIAARYNLTTVDALCIEKVLDEDSSADTTSEAEILGTETLLKFQSEIIAQQAKEIDKFKTMFVMSVLKKPDIGLSGIIGVKGAVIEQTIENVFDLRLSFGVESKSVKLWNARFSLILSVKGKEIGGQTAKYLSITLACKLPDKWSCSIKACIVVENSFQTDNKCIATKTFSKNYKSPESLLCSSSYFVELSKFLSGTPPNIYIYKGRVVTYILAEEPAKEDPEEDLEEDFEEDSELEDYEE